MSKWTRRSIALLLVPSLLFEPVTASAFQNSSMGRHGDGRPPVNGIIPSTRFSEEALAAPPIDSSAIVHAPGEIQTDRQAAGYLRSISRRDLLAVFVTGVAMGLFWRTNALSQSAGRREALIQEGKMTELLADLWKDKDDPRIRSAESTQEMTTAM